MNILTIVIETLALIVAGTMVGNELSVGAFVHPELSRLDDHSHTRSARALAATFGRVMPFWYAFTIILSIAVVFLKPIAWSLSWWLACASAALFIISIVYTIIGLVPVNDRIGSWNPDALPADWRKQRQKWDQLHGIRVVLLLIALITLTVSILLG